MNFEWNGKLAERQDRVIDGFPNIIADDFDALKKNIIVPIANILSPCNLTVRHACLLDLLENIPSRTRRIKNQCCLLTNWTTASWLEGYSYWCYTRGILDTYAEKFSILWLKTFVVDQNLKFNVIAYSRNGKLYPPPFGDLWDDSLQEQDGHTNVPELIKVDTWPVRFNLHTKTVHRIYDVSSGQPIDDKTREPFVFYTGYKNKYPTKWSELWALVKRFFSLILNIFEEV
jgi:hypothetical protein